MPDPTDLDVLMTNVHDELIDALGDGISLENVVRRILKVIDDEGHLTGVEL